MGSVPRDYEASVVSGKHIHAQSLTVARGRRGHVLSCKDDAGTCAWVENPVSTVVSVGTGVGSTGLESEQGQLRQFGYLLSMTDFSTFRIGNMVHLHATMLMELQAGEVLRSSINTPLTLFSIGAIEHVPRSPSLAAVSICSVPLGSPQLGGWIGVIDTSGVLTVGYQNDPFTPASNMAIRVTSVFLAPALDSYF